uniref:Ig-like domain-containing protein n=1 Tax=Cyanoderma ruficeps TaxID=181631 RepID=A0A8C3QV87_9PASS
WIPSSSHLHLTSILSGASDTPELIGAVGGSVTFHVPKTDPEGKAALWSFGNIPIATVPFEDPSRSLFSKEKFITRLAVSEGGRALSISQLRMEDAGTYSVTINRKISTFTLLVYKELPEPTVTCEPQNCSGGICSFSLRCSVTGAGFGNVSYTWRRRGHLRDEGSVVELMAVKKSRQEEPDPVTCTARNAVSSRNVTVTAPAGLCSEPGKGAPSGSWVRIGVVAGVEIAAILSVFLIFFCKSRGESGKPSLEPREGVGGDLGGIWG